MKWLACAVTALLVAACGNKGNLKSPTEIAEEQARAEQKQDKAMRRQQRKSQDADATKTESGDGSF